MSWSSDIPDVVPGQPVASSWGNEIRDSVVHNVATVAALPADVSDGSVAYVVADGQLYTRHTGKWWTRRTFLGLPKTTDSNGLVTFTAAELGFVTLTGGSAHVSAGAAAVTTVAFSGFSVSGANITVRCFRFTVGGAADSQINVVQGSARTFNIHAEGYVT